MGLINHGIAEILENQRLRTEGKISREEFQDKLSSIRELTKHVNQLLTIEISVAKLGGKKLKKETFEKMGLISPGSVVDIARYAISDTIACPDTDKIITRLQCKEYSEKTGNLGTCSTCDNFQTTRKLLGSAHKEIA